MGISAARADEVAVDNGRQQTICAAKLKLGGGPRAYEVHKTINDTFKQASAVGRKGPLFCPRRRRRRQRGLLTSSSSERGKTSQQR